MPLSKLASVSLLHVLVATASSSVCDATQLLSHSKNLYAVSVVASDRQNKLCKPNPDHLPFVSALYSLSALLRPITFCNVELCLSKFPPRRAITPDVLRRVTVSPARSLSTCTSKCDLFGSCAGIAAPSLALLSGTSPHVSTASCDQLLVST